MIRLANIGSIYIAREPGRKKIAPAMHTFLLILAITGIFGILYMLLFRNLH